MPSPRRIALASVAIAAVVPLTGCDPDLIGAAAVVGEERIGIDDVQAEAERVFDTAVELGAQGPALAELQNTAIDRRVRGILLEDVAAEAGVQASPAQIDALYLEQEQTAGAPEDFPALLAQNGYDEETFRAVLQENVLAQGMITELGGDSAALTTLIADRGEELGVQINPRYGTWDQIALVPGSGSISEPVGVDAETPMLPPNG